MKEEREMKRVLQSFVLMVILALSPMTSKAQIFIMSQDEEAISNRTPGNVDEIPVPPINLDNDWIPGNNGGGGGGNNYTPIGDGLLTLTLLGGAYLLGKRKSHVRPN